MMKSIECLCLLALGSNLPLLISAQESEFSIAPLCESLLPYSYDSGETHEATSTVVSHPDAPWIQLDLTQTRLAANAKLVLRGSMATQELDAAALTLASNGYSAMFEGDSVSVEVVHYSPDGRRLGQGAKGAKRAKGAKEEGSMDGDSGKAASRVVVSNVVVGMCEDTAKVASICGSSDDRAASTDKRQGRIGLGGSCTAFLVSKTVFVTAGHCGDAKSNSRISFTFGARGDPVLPKDQYAVDLSTFKRGCGCSACASSCTSLDDPDFIVGRFLPNSETGLFPGDAQGIWYTISTTAPSVGNTVRITGYGTSSSSSKNLMQQTHTGSVTEVKTKYIGYRVDSMVSLRLYFRACDYILTDTIFQPHGIVHCSPRPHSTYYRQATPVAPSSTKVRKKS
jgi:V8-like Glu-specific endopeptidase